MAIGVTSRAAASRRRLTASMPPSSAVRSAASTTRSVVSPRWALTSRAMLLVYAVHIGLRRRPMWEWGAPRGRHRMNRLGIAGAVWLAAAGFSIAMTLIFRVDPVQWIVTTAVGVVAAVVGLWLIARPSALVVSASNVV